MLGGRHFCLGVKAEQGEAQFKKNYTSDGKNKEHDIEVDWRTESISDWNKNLIIS